MMNSSTVHNKGADEPQALSFTLKVNKLCSEVFTLGRCKWRIQIFPRGNRPNSLVYSSEYLPVYLEVADPASLPYGWTRYAEFSLAIVDQVHSQYTMKKDRKHLFNQYNSSCDFTSFIPLAKLYDSRRGYLVNDTCVIQAHFTILNGSGIARLPEPPSSVHLPVGDDLGDLFTDMDYFTEPVMVDKLASSAAWPTPLDCLDQAREKLKALLALGLNDVAEHRGEIIGLATVLSSSSIEMKELLKELMSTRVLESILSRKTEVADSVQKMSKRQVVANAFREMQTALESLMTEKQHANDQMEAHKKTIFECEAEIERLEKKIVYHKEEFSKAEQKANKRKETFQKEIARAVVMKEELVATRGAAMSWKAAHAIALAKQEELEREWRAIASKINL